ncbi:HlyD family type I secretion periplasmic adaptor subunit [Radicibacter daui]|uniref:HlyD family type I secretion periplasmic adaptor subunit n=1 Tax=Radicibacter daui TaxID=3064829 RepID=UPI004046E0C2
MSPDSLDRDPSPANSETTPPPETARSPQPGRRKLAWGADEREFLPAALEIIDTPPSPAGQAVGLTIAALATIAVAWACIGKLDIIVAAPGSIIPDGKTKIVQPVETGIVKAIHVADGDHVAAGAPLIELNDEQALADRDRFRRDLKQARLTLSRYRGLAAPFSETGNTTPLALIDPPGNASTAEIALTQTAMRAEAALQDGTLAELDQQAAGKRAEAQEAQATIDKIEATLPMVRLQEQIRRELKDKEFGNKLAWYQANQQLIEYTQELPAERSRKQAAEAAVYAIQQKRAAAVAQYQVDILQQLDKTAAQVSELTAALIKAEQQLSQMTLSAPIDGTVQQLAIHTVGGVVTPAEQLLSVVPDQGRLVVEAMIQNKDVGFVRAGQPARIKIDAFPFTRYGIIEGAVLNVTRDAIQGADKSSATRKAASAAGDDNTGSRDGSAPAYIARIELGTDTIETETGPARLGPGMQVSAEIQTGQRRIIEYLLSPILRRVDESMRER